MAGGKGKSSGVGGPSVLDRTGQTNLRAPAQSALALHSADVHSRALHDPGVPLADAWQGLQGGLGPAETAVGAVDHALGEFIKASSVQGGAGSAAAAAAAAMKARQVAALAQARVKELLHRIAAAADDLEEATRRAIAMQLPDGAVAPFPPHLYCDPLRASRLAQEDLSDVVPRLDAAALAGIYGNESLPGANEEEQRIRSSLAELPRSVAGERAASQSGAVGAGWGRSGTVIRGDLASAQSAARMGARASAEAGLGPLPMPGALPSS